MILLCDDGRELETVGVALKDAPYISYGSVVSTYYATRPDISNSIWNWTKASTLNYRETRTYTFGSNFSITVRRDGSTNYFCTIISNFGEYSANTTFQIFASVTNFVEIIVSPPSALYSTAPYYDPTQKIVVVKPSKSNPAVNWETSMGVGQTEDIRSYYGWQGALLAQPPEFPWKDEGTTTGGGQGAWGDDSSDGINPPSVTDLNTNQLTDTFFATTYRLSKEELRALGGVMWTPSVVESLKSLFGNPLESIINLYMLPFDSYKGNKVQIVLGTYHTGIVGYLTDQYKEINCGVLEIPEKWAGALDYESRVQIYLPFIGTKELDTAEVMGGQIGVKYLIDILTGACVAYVSVKKGTLESVLYQFTGNCSYSFPLTQANYNSFYSALLSATATVASGVVTGGASVPMMVGAGASVGMSAKTHVAHSGNLAGNTGYMGIKKPYVILTRPIQALPKDFGKYRGYQSHITKKLGDCSGFTQIEYIHLDGIDRATSEELTEIENLLKGGVIIA